MVEKWKKGSFYEFMIHIKEGPHTVLFMVGESVNNIMILNKKRNEFINKFVHIFFKICFSSLLPFKKKMKILKR